MLGAPGGFKKFCHTTATTTTRPRATRAQDKHNKVTRAPVLSRADRDSGAQDVSRRGARPLSLANSVQTRFEAVAAAARFHGVELDRRDYRAVAGEEIPSPASLAKWLQESGLWAKAVRLHWRQLLRFQSDAPIVLLFSDGSAGLLIGRDPARNVVFIKSPHAPLGDAPIAVDELRLTQLWQGEALLLRRGRGSSHEEEPFTLAWLAHLVLQYCER
jgi:subfamily B ATP-binding cassette protein HlyB/CyaB